MINQRLRNKKIPAVEMFLPFFGLLVQYQISIFPVSAIMMAIIVLYQGKISLKSVCRPYLFFLAYTIARDFLHIVFSQYDAASNQINIMISYTVQFLLIFIICGNDFDENVLYKWWKIAGTIFGLGMVYHVIQIVGLGNTVTPISIIPGYLMRSDALEGSWRPTSFFAEPAAYVTSMMPLLFLALKRKDLKWAIVSTFLIVMSTSTVGVVLVTVLWVAFILLEKKSFKLTLTVLFFIAVFLLLFMKLPIFTTTLQKVEEVTQGESTWGSRVQAPFELVGTMKPLELPFGADIIEPRQYAYQNIDRIKSGTMLMSFLILDDDAMFLNTYASLIFRYGIVGLALFLYSFVFKRKLFNRNYEARMYAIMLSVACLAQTSLMRPNAALMIILLYDAKMQAKETATRSLTQN